MSKKQERLALFVFAVFFFLVLLIVIIVALSLDSPNTSPVFPFFIFLCRTICAVCAAIILGFLPGALDIDWAKSLGIRASGAIAGFVLVFMVNPPALTSDLVSWNSTYQSCDRGLSRRSGPNLNEREQCLTLASMRPSDWRVPHALGRLAWHDGDTKTAISKSQEALIALRSVKDSSAKVSDVQRVRTGLGVYLLELPSKSNAFEAIENARALLSSERNLLLSQKIDWSWQFSDAAYILSKWHSRDDHLFEAKGLLDELSVQTLKPIASAWNDYRSACVLLALHAQRGAEGAEKLIGRAVKTLDETISETSGANAELLGCKLFETTLEGCSYVGTHPPNCPDISKHIPIEFLEESKKLL